MSMQVTREQFVGATYSELLAENAKLRELVSDMFAHEAIDCKHCSYSKQCKAHETTHYTVGIIIRKRARELGVDE